MMSRCAASMRSVRRLPRYLWLIFAIKVLESYAYFSQSLSMMLYLTDEHGFSDANAGWLCIVRAELS